MFDMFKKIGKVFLKSIKVTKKDESFFLFAVPLLITILLYILFNKHIMNNTEFINDFIGDAITVISLLSAFGLASLSILISSSSNNIEEAKKTPCEDRKVNGIKISYYQLQLYRTIFSLLIQFFLLILLIAFKFCNLCICSFIMGFYFHFILFLLFVSLFFQIFTVVSIYYLFIQPK